MAMAQTRSAANSAPLFSAVRRQPVSTKSAALRRRHIRHGVLLLVLGVSFAILFVWTRIQVIHLGYEVSRIRKETQELTEQKNMLEAEVASLKSPKRLERIASEVLGMRLPMAHEIVFVTPGRLEKDYAEIQDHREKR